MVAQIPDSDCLSKRSWYEGPLWAVSVQSDKLSHQATVRKTTPIPSREGDPSVVQSPPRRMVVRGGHIERCVETARAAIAVRLCASRFLSRHSTIRMSQKQLARVFRSQAAMS